MEFIFKLCMERRIVCGCWGKYHRLGRFDALYSGLTLNQYGVALPCRTICTVCGFVALS